jgi:hypothetical protein
LPSIAPSASLANQDIYGAIRITNAIQVPRVMDYQNLYNVANRNKTPPVVGRDLIKQIEILV